MTQKEKSSDFLSARALDVPRTNGRGSSEYRAMVGGAVVTIVVAAASLFGASATDVEKIRDALINIVQTVPVVYAGVVAVYASARTLLKIVLSVKK